MSSLELRFRISLQCTLSLLVYMVLTTFCTLDWIPYCQNEVITSWNQSPISHYDDVKMGTMTSQINNLTIVYSNRLFRRRSKKTSKLRVTGLCAGNSPGTGEFPAQMASNAENVSISWRHHEISLTSHSFVRWLCMDEVDWVLIWRRDY